MAVHCDTTTVTAGRGVSRAESALKRNLAYAARILSQNGHDDLNQGQVSARLPGWDQFYIKPAVIGFNEACPDDMVAAPVDHSLEHAANCPPELPLHQALYERRPDVNAIIHSHAPYGLMAGAKALAIEPISHEGALFVDALPRFVQTSHTVLEIETGYAIADCLGNCAAVLLVNHGSVVVGETIRAATVMAHALERACRIQLMAAMLPGIPHSVASSDDVERKRRYIYSDTSIKAFWDYCVRTVERNSAEVRQWKTR